MGNNEFIPVDIKDLYQKLKNENFKGQLSVTDDWLIWNFSNKIIIKVTINQIPREGYIETIYLSNGEEISLTHWHPMEEEIYSDLSDINTGEIIWIIKKKKFLFKPFPFHISKKTYDSFSEKKKNKYYILD